MSTLLAYRRKNLCHLSEVLQNLFSVFAQKSKPREDGHSFSSWLSSSTLELQVFALYTISQRIPKLNVSLSPSLGVGPNRQMIPYLGPCSGPLRFPQVSLWTHWMLFRKDFDHLKQSFWWPWFPLKMSEKLTSSALWIHTMPFWQLEL